MATTTEKKVFVDVTIKMRLGVADDFKTEKWVLNADGVLTPEPAPKIGQPYWEKSEITGEFDNRNRQIQEDWTSEDWAEFKELLKRDMIYVPAGYFELKEAGES